jgi:hypothetical protein
VALGLVGWFVIGRSDRPPLGEKLSRPDLGFHFQYPNTWQEISEQDLQHKNEKFVAGVQYRGVPSTAIGVIVQSRSDSLSDEYRTLRPVIEEKLAASLAGFQKLASRPARSGDARGLTIEYKYTPLNQAPVHQQQLILLARQRVYYVSASALEAKYSSYRQDIEQILESFTIDGN